MKSKNNFNRKDFLSILLLSVFFSVTTNSLAMNGMEGSVLLGGSDLDTYLSEDLIEPRASEFIGGFFDRDLLDRLKYSEPKQMIIAPKIKSNIIDEQEIKEQSKRFAKEVLGSGCDQYEGIDLRESSDTVHEQNELKSGSEFSLDGVELYLPSESIEGELPFEIVELMYKEGKDSSNKGGNTESQEKKTGSETEVSLEKKSAKDIKSSVEKLKNSLPKALSGKKPDIEEIKRELEKIERDVRIREYNIILNEEVMRRKEKSSAKKVDNKKVNNLTINILRQFKEKYDELIENSELREKTFLIIEYQPGKNGEKETESMIKRLLEKGVYGIKMPFGYYIGGDVFDDLEGIKIKKIVLQGDNKAVPHAMVVEKLIKMLDRIVVEEVIFPNVAWGKGSAKKIIDRNLELVRTKHRCALLIERCDPLIKAERELESRIDYKLEELKKEHKEREKEEEIMKKKKKEEERIRKERKEEKRRLKEKKKKEEEKRKEEMKKEAKKDMEDFKKLMRDKWNNGVEESGSDDRSGFFKRFLRDKCWWDDDPNGEGGSSGGYCNIQ